MVELVFTDRSRQTVTEEEAFAICRNNEISGRIVDALTVDVKLQIKLRSIMDKTGE